MPANIAEDVSLTPGSETSMRITEPVEKSTPSQHALQQQYFLWGEAALSERVIHGTEIMVHGRLTRPKRSNEQGQAWNRDWTRGVY
jgi:hypothetical protein